MSDGRLMRVPSGTMTQGDFEITLILGSDKADVYDRRKGSTLLFTLSDFVTNDNCEEFFTDIGGQLLECGRATKDSTFGLVTLPAGSRLSLINRSKSSS